MISVPSGELDKYQYNQSIIAYIDVILSNLISPMFFSVVRIQSSATTDACPRECQLKMNSCNHLSSACYERFARKRVRPATVASWIS
jgi:hypothetical protein